MRKLLFLLAFLLAAPAYAQFADQRQYAPTTGGNANAQTVAIPNYALNVGVALRFTPSFTNTTAMTLNANGSGVVPVSKISAVGPVALSGGEVVQNQVSEVIFDGTQYELLTAPIYDFGTQTSIASATTTDLGTITSHNALITGTATITSFGSSASLATPFYIAKFAAAVTLTNSASLAIPGGDTIVTNANDSFLLQYLGSGNWAVVAYWPAVSFGGIPGEIRQFAMQTCPNGWQAADGTAISRTTYAGLFANIGTTWGVGDGTTTFNVPDGRGRFMRQWDNGAGRDPARAFASAQAGNIASTVGTSAGTVTGTMSGTATGAGQVLELTSGSLNAAGGTNVNTQTALTVTGTISGTSTGTATVGTGTDTRPINIAIQECIKL